MPSCTDVFILNSNFRLECIVNRKRYWLTLSDFSSVSFFRPDILCRVGSCPEFSYTLSRFGKYA